MAASVTVVCDHCGEEDETGEGQVGDIILMPDDWGTDYQGQTCCPPCLKREMADDDEEGEDE